MTDPAHDLLPHIFCGVIGSTTTLDELRPYAESLRLAARMIDEAETIDPLVMYAQMWDAEIQRRMREEYRAAVAADDDDDPVASHLPGTRISEWRPVLPPLPGSGDQS